MPPIDRTAMNVSLYYYKRVSQFYQTFCTPFPQYDQTNFIECTLKYSIDLAQYLCTTLTTLIRTPSLSQNIYKCNHNTHTHAILCTDVISCRNGFTIMSIQGQSPLFSYRFWDLNSNILGPGGVENSYCHASFCLQQSSFNNLLIYVSMNYW